MAQGLDLEWKDKPRVIDSDEKKTTVRIARKNVEGRAMGSRRIFAPNFKLKVLDSYRQDPDCRGNQRATARKYGIHRRQIQKWLQVEASLRSSVELGVGPTSELTALNLCGAARLRDDTAASATAAGESQAYSQLGSTSVDNNQAPNHLADRTDVCDVRPLDNEEVSKRVNISLFPNVRIEQLSATDCRPNPSNLINSVSRSSSENSSDINKQMSADLYPRVKIEGIFETQEPDFSYDLKEETLSDDDDLLPVVGTEQALDFTCAALSKRRSFSLQFKLEVLDAFHADRHCHGNQRATARKFGINRRQVQKWLHQEAELRGETITSRGMFRQRLGKWMDVDEIKHAEENRESNPKVYDADPLRLPRDDCEDLLNRKRKAQFPVNVAPYKKRPLELLKRQNDDCECEDVSSSAENDFSDVQETALCLVKVKHVPKESQLGEEKLCLNHSEVSSSADLQRVVGQALYHSNRDQIIPPYIPLPLVPPHSFYCFPQQGLHQMLNHYRGFVIHR